LRARLSRGSGLPRWPCEPAWALELGDVGVDVGAHLGGR